MKTPTPWYVVRHVDGKWTIQDQERGGGNQIAMQYGRSDIEDAEFICRAVNCHDELLKCLRWFEGYYTQAGIGDCLEGHDDDDDGDMFDGDERFNVRHARAAIEKATAPAVESETGR